MTRSPMDLLLCLALVVPAFVAAADAPSEPSAPTAADVAGTVDPDAVETVKARMQALIDLGNESYRRSDYLRARKAFEEALGHACDLGNRRAEAVIVAAKARS